MARRSVETAPTQRAIQSNTEQYWKKHALELQTRLRMSVVYPEISLWEQTAFWAKPVVENAER